jgi:hypothetical protein
MPEAKSEASVVTEVQSEGAKKILERVGTKRMNEETLRSYREFVESVNRAKESDMARVMMPR